MSLNLVFGHPALLYQLPHTVLKVIQNTLCDTSCIFCSFIIEKVFYIDTNNSKEAFTNISCLFEYKKHSIDAIYVKFYLKVVPIISVCMRTGAENRSCLIFVFSLF